MLYCYKTSDDHPTKIDSWRLIDLDSIRRKTSSDEGWADCLPIRYASNGDATRIVPLGDLDNPVVAIGDQSQERVETDDGEWVTVTVTRTATMRRRKADMALCGAM